MKGLIELAKVFLQKVQKYLYFLCFISTHEAKLDGLSLSR
jgi:hypothetical protein